VALVGGRVVAGHDAGEFIERDMIGVRVSPDQRAAIVGSSRYLESHPKPDSPHDLTRHRCLNFRHGSAGVYRWEFDKGNQSLAVAGQGRLIVDDAEIMIRAAIDGVGLAFMLEEQAAPHLANGALVRVLEDWCPPFAGYFLYYPSRRQQPAALTALIETLRLEGHPLENRVLFALMTFGNDQANRLPHGLLCRIAEYSLRSGIPRRDDTIHVFADDGIIARFHE